MKLGNRDCVVITEDIPKLREYCNMVLGKNIN